MKRMKTLVFLLILGAAFAVFGQDQTSAKVSEPRLEIENDKLHIYFDIIDSEPDEEFSVTVIIESEDGRQIVARSLEGDVGKDIEGGNNRHVIWDYEADKVFLNEYLSVKVRVSRMKSTKASVAQNNSAVQNEIDEPQVNKKEPSRTSIILQSVVVPGLGLTRVTGKPHWIKGVAGYGCIAGSVVMNRMAISSFNSIGDLETESEISDAYNKSIQQDNVSEILAYAAIGIWVTDMIWTLVGTSHMKGVNLTSYIDPVTNVASVGVVYRF